MIWLLLACTGKEDGTADTQPAAPTVCEGGDGFVQDPATAIHVQADGDDQGGDGSLAFPYATLSRALAAWEARGSGGEIAIGEGIFDAELDLTSDQDGLVLAGCEGTVLRGGSSAPAVKVTAAELTLRGLTVQGGVVGISAWSGAYLVLTDLVAAENTGAGILIRGTDTVAELDRVTVRDPTAATVDGIQAGFGVVSLDSTVRWSQGGVDGATMVGFIADGGSVTAEGLTIVDTQATGGRFGRGFQAQGCDAVSFSDGVLRDNSDAGIVLFETASATLTSNRVDGTQAAAIDGSQATTGDGIVVSQSGGDVASFTVTLQGNTVTGSARAGILLDGVTASLDSNTAGSDNGLSQSGTSLLSQASAVVSGSDAVEELTQAVSLERAAYDLSGL